MVVLLPCYNDAARIHHFAISALCISWLFITSTTEHVMRVLCWWRLQRGNAHLWSVTSNLIRITIKSYKKGNYLIIIFQALKLHKAGWYTATCNHVCFVSYVVIFWKVTYALFPITNFVKKIKNSYILCCIDRRWRKIQVFVSS